MSENNITLDDLNYFWMPNGAPCFIADQENFCEIVESLGFSIYYLFTNEEKIETKTSTSYKPNTPGGPSVSSTQTVNVVHHIPKLFKVVSNFVGRSVSQSTDPLPETFGALQEECLYNLPLIPFDIVQKLDEFFRLVHAKHGTESIVLLTFDHTVEDSSGWGVLVPEQSNTAAHCNYNAESILEIKPENAIIVGSVHSHPEMPAYASGTDHADQADFDGIHITYGWQKSVNGGATQYHLELQMSGKSFKLDVEDVFEGFNINKDPDPEVVAWSDQVKKALPPTWGGHSDTVATPVHQNQMTAMGTPATTLGYRNSFYKQNISTLNVEADAVVIAEVYQQSDGSAVCPSCDFDLDDADFYNSYCQICDIPIALESTSINVIGRSIQKYRSIRNLATDTKVYLWARDIEGEQFLIDINMEKALGNTFYEEQDFEDGKISAIKDAYEDFDNYPIEDNYDFDPEKLVCCNQPQEDYLSACTCPTTVFHSDFKAFDVATSKMNIYEELSDCNSCLHYFSPQCPRLVEMIAGYIDAEYSELYIEAIDKITECGEYTRFGDSTNYLYEDERYYH